MAQSTGLPFLTEYHKEGEESRQGVLVGPPHLFASKESEWRGLFVSKECLLGGLFLIAPECPGPCPGSVSLFRV